MKPTEVERENQRAAYARLALLEAIEGDPFDDAVLESDRKNFEAEHQWDHRTGRQFGDVR